MILKMIKKYTSVDDPVRFLQVHFNKFTEDIQAVLRTINVDNMDGQLVQGISIGPGEEAQIPHSLTVIPRFRIILNQSALGGIIKNGFQPWTNEYITLLNDGADLTRIDVFILR